VRRHPHVFGEGASRKISHINRRWEEIKRAEKPQRKSALDGLPLSLPALLRAQRMQDKMSADPSFPGSSLAIEKKVDSEWKNLRAGIRKDSKVRIEESLGRLLFHLSLLAHHQKTNAEMALRRTNRQAGKDFRKRERLALTKAGA